MKNVNFDSYTDILLKTRERLTDPKNWCGNGNGRNVDGGICLGFTLLAVLGVDSPYCGVDNSKFEHYGRIEDNVFRSLMGGLSIPVWNDSHTHAEVLELLDTAIAQRMQVAA